MVTRADTLQRAGNSDYLAELDRQHLLPEYAPSFLCSSALKLSRTDASIQARAKLVGSDHVSLVGSAARFGA